VKVRRESQAAAEGEQDDDACSIDEHQPSPGGAQALHNAHLLAALAITRTSVSGLTSTNFPLTDIDLLSN
jgi:hypothetical protein